MLNVSQLEKILRAASGINTLLNLPGNSEVLSLASKKMDDIEELLKEVIFSMRLKIEVVKNDQL